MIDVISGIAILACFAVMALACWMEYRSHKHGPSVLSERARKVYQDWKWW